MSKRLVESFIQSPYHVNDLSCWRHEVQLMINQVVQHYFQLPRNIQNSISFMKLFDTYRKNLNIAGFESVTHYCMVMAKITDHLLTFLSSEAKQVPQLYYYQRQEELLEEREPSISLNVELTEYSSKLYTMKKYLLLADEKLIKLFQLVMSVYSVHVYGNLPDKVQIVTLLDGKAYEYSPTMEDVMLGQQYVKDLKETKKRQESWGRRL
ncbi:hypothetical protein M3175_11025 [Robertmurraya korlensis]|uniref:hypothetical protein n=1 Tax=Robertmurraya korlensis TaxID=519977 RepID=UPI00203A6B42|nr:hypothetical protein [Robertmurraya korlensis]MCM3601264.1 hypothetical protein [Robertmurraya korlensis]